MKKLNVLAIMAIFMIGILSVMGAYAFNPADLEKLKTTNSCESCDLTGAYLLMADLREADLHQANLNGATWTDGSTCKEGSIGRRVR